jgi:Ca2+-binding RTX toxin-like protein
MASCFNVKSLLAYGALLAAFGCGATDGTDITLSSEGEPGVAEPGEGAQLPSEDDSLELGEAEQALSVQAPVSPLDPTALDPLVPPIAIPFCPAGQNVSGVQFFNGGPFSDIVAGTGQNDVLIGGTCDDDLSGAPGDDILSGEEGDDTVGGGAGDDNLSGGDDDDVVNGGPDNDVLFGGAGDDVLDGGPGDDELHGGCGVFTDTIDGGPGRDLCEGNCGRDTFVNCEVIRCCP